MLEKIKALQEEINALSASIKEEAEELRIKYLSKKGVISQLFEEFKNVPVDQKKLIGAALNELKNHATDRINSLRENFETNRSGAEGLDLTLPGETIKIGSRHPLSIVRNDIIRIFSRLGFVVSEGPEIEDDWHVFSALNLSLIHI